LRQATPPSRANAESGVISEVFRVFQAKLRTSRAAPGYPTTALRIANKSEVNGMGRKSGGDMILKKRFHLFEIGALLLAICAAPSGNATAAGDPAESGDSGF
jgi:hypothetical protein